MEMTRAQMLVVESLGALIVLIWAFGWFVATTVVAIIDAWQVHAGLPVGWIGLVGWSAVAAESVAALIAAGLLLWANRFCRRHWRLD
jgi:hypothetical protein